MSQLIAMDECFDYVYVWSVPGSASQYVVFIFLLLFCVSCWDALRKTLMHRTLQYNMCVEPVTTGVPRYVK